MKHALFALVVVYLVEAAVWPSLALTPSRGTISIKSVREQDVNRLAVDVFDGHPDRISRSALVTFDADVAADRGRPDLTRGGLPSKSRSERVDGADPLLDHF